VISLYFHIPFCTKKCDYCHFYVIPDKPPFQALLIEGLSRDIALWQPQLAGKKLASIYFGGGTPSLLAPEAIFSLIESVRKIIHFNPDEIEITLEANPETLSIERMREYAAAGVNRVSIGIQSLDDRLLMKLGRTHHASTAIDAVNEVSQAGISNISIDLMYDIPGQTLATWLETLKLVEQLPITHLSLYNLTIEPHTVFFKYREALKKELPDAECSTLMYRQAVEILESYGLAQYEISAFSRNGKISIHNSGYWTGRPFIGFGPSAFSYWEGKRFRAVANLNHYVQALREGRSPIDFSEELEEEPHRRELLAIALRMRCGVDLTTFETVNGTLSATTQKSLSKLEEQGLLEKQGNVLRLTQQGILFYDTIAVELI